MINLNDKELILERNRLKIRKAKMEFMEFETGNEMGSNGSGHGVRLGSQLLNRVNKFNHLVSVVQKNMGTAEDAASRIRCGWMKKFEIFFFFGNMRPSIFLLNTTL